MITKQKPTLTWKGWSCKQWVKSKKIIGSFWIGSFDTTFTQETYVVSPLECWDMINNKKCGENVMQSGTTTLIFTASRVGEGKWYATREYHALNCLVEEISLKQDPSEHQIESPFGLLNATQKDGHNIYNHNTIVWGEIKSLNDASTTTLFRGNGYLEISRTTELNNISRLVDNRKQIEIIFYNKPDISNKELPEPVFPVVGMPKTFVLLSTNPTIQLHMDNQYVLNQCEKSIKKNTIL